MRTRTVALTFLFGFLAALAQAQVIHVPADMGLQAAIDAIPNGGLIQVSAGTYASPANGFQIVNKGKGFTIQGVGGTVVLSGGGANRVLYLANSSLGAGRPIVFDSLTFASGRTGTDGVAAGATVITAQATFVNCVFTGNAGHGAGGATVVANGSSVLFLRASWSSNTSVVAGGALSVQSGSNVFIHDSEFLGNRTNLPGHFANAAGGAVYVTNSNVRISNSRFVGNEAGYVGGAVYVIGSWVDPVSNPSAQVTIADCYFGANKARRDSGQTSSVPTEGGAIHDEAQSTTRIYNSRFVSNQADVGGGVNTYRGVLQVYSSVFQGNTTMGTPSVTTSFGGAVSAHSNDSPSDGGTNRRSAQLVLWDSLVQGKIDGQTQFPNVGGCLAVVGDEMRQYGLGGVPRIDNLSANRATADVERDVFFDCDVAGANSIGGGIQTGLTSLTLSDSIVMRSDAQYGGGLAIFDRSLATVRSSTFAENTAVSGGGVFAQGSTLNVSYSALVRNYGSADGAAIETGPDFSRSIPIDGMVFGNTFGENTGGTAIWETDVNSATLYNAVQYDANLVHASGNPYCNSIAGCLTVPQLNLVVVSRSAGPSTDKSPSNNNSATSTPPVVGQILAVPPAILSTGAHNEVGPFPSYVGYAWAGVTFATFNGAARSGSWVDPADTPGLQTLQVGPSTYTTTVDSASVPGLALYSNPAIVRPGNSFALSWLALGDTVLEVGFDQGVGASPYSSGTVSVVPSATTTYRGVTVNAEGGADATTGVVVGIPPVDVTPKRFAEGTVGATYSQTFAQTGGSGTISWALTGSLPTGLSFNTATAQLSGVPSQSGVFWIQVTARDSFGTTGSVSGPLNINRVAPFVPVSVSLDAAGDGVLEPGESVVVAPSWRNATGAAASVAGSATFFLGPGDSSYTVVDGAASYGTVANGATASCSATGDCYQLALSVPTARPSHHWDAALGEVLTSGDQRIWMLHVGDSFDDVPRTSPYYRYVETMLHNSVTAGCSATSYCPAGLVSREQMAVFTLLAKEGPGYAPPACGTPMFSDVPAASPMCKWIEELARRGVVSGCGGGNFCPTYDVSRAQMAVFMLRTLDPSLSPPACGTPVFSDVPASSPFCAWIEELARRGVVSGCGGGNYCPSDVVTRGQMSAFLTLTFGLTLYGP